MSPPAFRVSASLPNRSRRAACARWRCRRRPRSTTFQRLKDQGIDVVLGNWRGVFAAPGITTAQRDALVAAVKTATDSPAWKESLTKFGWDAWFLGRRSIQGVSRRRRQAHQRDHRLARPEKVAWRVAPRARAPSSRFRRACWRSVRSRWSPRCACLRRAAIPESGRTRYRSLLQGVWLLLGIWLLIEAAGRRLARAHLGRSGRARRACVPRAGIRVGHRRTVRTDGADSHGRIRARSRRAVRVCCARLWQRRDLCAMR